MSEHDTDLAEAIAQFTNYIMNERVRCYNEGLDAERQRCSAICESWIGTFQDKEIKYTSAREYAIDAIEDIIDLIREGKPVAVGSPVLTHEKGE